MKGRLKWYELNKCEACGRYYLKMYPRQVSCSSGCTVYLKRQRDKRKQEEQFERESAAIKAKSLTDIQRMAFAEHLSYGQYVAKYHI